MKKTLLFFIFLLCNAVLINAQDIIFQRPRVPKGWIDLQIAQSFGLNDWYKVKFASDRLPNISSSTDLRITANLHIIERSVGIFADMGVGIIPAPRNGYSDPADQAMLATGIRYYTKEITVENGYQSASGNFKMTFGLFGNISATDKLSVLPYLGIGFTSITAPTCEAILKEYDTNMQYIARYGWFDLDEFEKVYPLTYVALRLRFAYHISSKINLLFGIEYSWYPERTDFSETYTNYFNHNIKDIIHHRSNRLNMLGLSLGISF